MTHPRLRRPLALASGLALLAASLAGAAQASTAGVGIASNPQIGHAILTDDRGVTLYRFIQDDGSTSTCYDGCARAWPPVVVDGVPAAEASLAAGLGTTVRTDGSLQLTFGGAPLYYYVGDRQPGEVTGQGSDGVWFVVDAPGRS